MLDAQTNQRPTGNGRVLAIGDIHGCHLALELLLKIVDPTSDDTVVVLGDVIDRGPCTRQVIDQLIEIQARCPLVLLMGNHEELFFESFTNEDLEEMWLTFGGFDTLNSYAEGCISESHVAFLKTAVDYFETETTVFVHANLAPGIPLNLQTPEWLRWKKLTKEEQPLASSKRVICGHTPQKEGLPWRGNGWVCIDTWAYGGQYITCLDLTHDLVYQASQSGQSRGPRPLAEVHSPWPANHEEEREEK